MAKLTKRQHDALKELARWRGSYWHCRTSMRQMEAMGLVETSPDPHSGHIGVNGPWRITDAGRAALSLDTQEAKHGRE